MTISQKTFDANTARLRAEMHERHAAERVRDAAPDLLSALKSILLTNDGPGPYGLFIHPGYRAAQQAGVAAIEKAEARPTYRRK